MSDQAVMGGPMGQPPPTTDQPAGQGGLSSADQAMDKATEAAAATKQKATEATDAAKDKAGQLADQAGTKVDAGLDKAAGGLDKAADMLRGKGEQAGDPGGALPSAATKAAEKLDAASGYLKDKDSEQLIADLEALVRRKPVESLLVALGAGFLVSKAFK